MIISIGQSRLRFGGGHVLWLVIECDPGRSEHVFTPLEPLRPRRIRTGGNVAAFQILQLWLGDDQLAMPIPAEAFHTIEADLALDLGSVQIRENRLVLDNTSGETTVLYFELSE